MSRRAEIDSWLDFKNRNVIETIAHRHRMHAKRSEAHSVVAVNATGEKQIVRSSKSEREREREREGARARARATNCNESHCAPKPASYKLINIRSPLPCYQNTLIYELFARIL